MDKKEWFEIECKITNIEHIKHEYCSYTSNYSSYKRIYFISSIGEECYINVSEKINFKIGEIIKCNRHVNSHSYVLIKNLDENK